MAISKTVFFFVLCILLLAIAPPLSGSSEHDMRYLKRSTMLLNRLMNALNKTYPHESFSVPQMELHRRGEGKMYWKCYFNAVSCFRRK
ncbi:hypothetical protein HNY73_006267 [Argiope bruennichi]|uniref:Uncharacterized protein n=1 Tax=Argiope bruennichi TaxID=94029 RepID=A0A8T0FPK8_ARGBR|nr:hypothetical protein HNY73_006267 [Argiope bruennichi]